MLVLIPLLHLAVPFLATMPDPEKDVEPDKRLASPREDVTLLEHADPPSLTDTENLAAKEKFVTEKELVSKSHPESKHSTPPFFLIPFVLLCLKQKSNTMLSPF